MLFKSDLEIVTVGEMTEIVKKGRKP